MRSAGATLLAGLALSCGGSSSPTGPSATPTTTLPPAASHTVAGVVFYDEDADGGLEGFEVARVGGVEVEVAGRTGRSETPTGRFVVTGVREGGAAAGVRPASLPPFFVAGPPTPVQVPQPQGAEALVALTLPIGSNRPHRYMAFGDSITVGDGSRNGSGYRDLLQDRLQSHFGKAEVANEGLRGGTSRFGADRIRERVGVRAPAYTLIVYGTNDWNSTECKQAAPCYTVEMLRAIVQRVKEARSLPVVATILPANPDYPTQVPPDRNRWITAVNEGIRQMAREEGAALADLHAAFLAEPDYRALMADHVHPDDAGYAIIARELFEGVTRPVGGGS